MWVTTAAWLLIYIGPPMALLQVEKSSEDCIQAMLYRLKQDPSLKLLCTAATVIVKK